MSRPSKEARKAQILEAVDLLTHVRGYPPSYRDLADSVGIAHSAIWYLVESLRIDGLIHEREAKHSRAITLTDAGRAAVGNLDPVPSSEAALYAAHLLSDR